MLFRSPDFGCGDSLAVFEGERVGKVWKWIRFGFVIVCFVGGAAPTAWTGAKFDDAELVHHVFVVVSGGPVGGGRVGSGGFGGA